LEVLSQIQNEHELNEEEESDDENSGKSKITEELTNLQLEVISSLRASVKAAQTTFGVNLYINIVIVVLGILLIVTSLVLSFFQGIDPFSVAFGGLGVANFVAVFLGNPQSRLQQNLCKLSQINIILTNFLYVYDRFLASTEETSSVKELTEINKECERITSFALESINEFVTPQEK